MNATENSPPITPAELREGMDSIALHYGRPFGPRHTIVWWNALSGLTSKQWWRAVDRVLDQEPSFHPPIPKDMRALAGVSQQYLPPTREWEPPSEEEQARNLAKIAEFKKQRGWA